MKPRGDRPPRREIPALKVRQWLHEWDKVAFDPSQRRRRPDSHFYVFSIAAQDLKALSGIYRRSARGGIPRASDTGIQRRHDVGRSAEIRAFIKHGYPWSALTEDQRNSGDFDALRKPGWLPTAVVVNIPEPDDVRQGEKVAADDLIELRDAPGSAATVVLPQSFSGPKWRPSARHPVEVIDGQHRLWAFEDLQLSGEFELPVVAFRGLDISWQAYQFWTINIKPKRINPSLAFDLYPLLRTEDWLERFEGHSVYRETRAQELTEHLWSQPMSPWFHRINMLGEPGMPRGMVTQAAWIRSLMASFVKSFEGPGVSIGGLFGALVGSDRQALPWSRAQQAAFLVFVGNELHRSVRDTNAEWAEMLRKQSQPNLLDPEFDPAFHGPHSLLANDQGIRAVLSTVNDMCFVRADELRLATWNVAEPAAVVDTLEISKVVRSLKRQPVAHYLGGLADAAATFDWRSSSAPGLTEQQQILRKAFRGSGGYKELRRHVLRHLTSVGEAYAEIKAAARDVITRLGY